MTVATRMVLPDTKVAITHRFCVGEIKGYINVSMVEGTPVEIFLTISKEGSTLGGMADAFARMVSIALQHGVPLKTICRKMRHLRFEPSGRTENTVIHEATSIIDYVFHWLQITFIDHEQRTEATNP